MLGHETHLNKFKKSEIMSSIFSDYHSIRPEINRRRKWKNNTQGLNNMLLNNPWVNKEIKREIRSDTGLPQEKRKISNKQSNNLTPKGTRKRRKNRAQNEYKEERNKDQRGKNERGDMITNTTEIIMGYSQQL